MKLLTKQLEKLWKKYPMLSQDGVPEEDKVIIGYFFNPFGSGTWLITEAEKREDGDWLLFGLCHIHEWEWGSVLLSMLENAHLGIERERTIDYGKDKLLDIAKSLGYKDVVYQNETDDENWVVPTI